MSCVDNRSVACVPAGHFYSAHGDAADFTPPYVILDPILVTSSQVSAGDVSLSVFATFPRVLLALVLT